MGTAMRPFLGWCATVILTAVILCHFPAAVGASDLSDPDKTEERELTHGAHDDEGVHPQTELQHFATQAGLSEVLDQGSSPPSREPEAPPTLALIPSEGAHENTESTQTYTIGHQRLVVATPDNDASATGDGEAPHRARLANILSGGGLRSRRRGTMSRGRRVFTLLVFLFFTILGGALFCGFKPLAQMMAEEGAYVDRCPPNTAANGTIAAGNLTTEALPNNGTVTPVPDQALAQLYRCAEQEAAVEGLYTFAFTTACVVSAAAGPFIDGAGARAANAVGNTLRLLGLVLFAFQHYTLGLMLLTAGEQTSFMSSLTLADLFPRSRSAVVGCIGGLASFSAAVPLVLREIRRALGTSVQNVMLGYAVAVGIPSLLAGIAFLPQRSVEESDATNGERRPASRLNAGGEGSLAGARAGPRLQRLLDFFRRALYALRNFWSEPALGTALFSRGFVYIFSIFTIAGVSSSYFVQSASHIFHGNASQHLDILFPLAVVPCTLLGLVADRLGSPVAIMVLGVSGVITNLVSFGPTDVAGYIAAVALMFYISALSSQVYWYSIQIFPRQVSGTLVGLVLMAGGLLSLMANPLYSSVTVRMLHGDTRWVRGGLLPLQILQLVLVYLAHREIQRQRGPLRQRRRIPRFHRRRRSYDLP